MFSVSGRGIGAFGAGAGPGGSLSVTASEIRRRPRRLLSLSRRRCIPCCRRVYAARGLQGSADLDLSLERLLPVSSLDGVDAAAQLLSAHRAGRVLVIGDFDADGATSTALVVRAARHALCARRFSGAQSISLRLRAHSGNRGVGGGAQPSLIVTVDNGVSSVAGVEAARAGHSRCWSRIIILPGAVLPRAQSSSIPTSLRPASRARRWPESESRFTSWPRLRNAVQDEFRVAGVAGPGGAGHGRRRRASGPQQPHLGGAGSAAHSRRAAACPVFARCSIRRAAAGRSPRPIWVLRWRRV